MRLEEEETNFPSRKTLRQQIPDRKKVPEFLGHLLPLDQQMCAVQPILNEPLSGWLKPRAFGLGDFIFVMREHQILATEMEVEARPQQLHAHCAALDVPAGP